MLAIPSSTGHGHDVHVLPSSTGIDKISSDLLGYIFALYASETWIQQEESKIRSLHTLRNLTLVSHFWSDVCHGVTEMWSYIDIDANQSSRSSKAALSRYLTRTASNSLSLRFTFDDAAHERPTTEQLIELFALVRSAIPRVVDLDLRVSMRGAAWESSDLFYPSSTWLNAPHLKRVRFDLGYPLLNHRNVLFHAPALRYLTTINAGLGIHVTVQRCLERLEIFTSSAFTSLTLAKVVEMISSLPAVAIKIDAQYAIRYANDELGKASECISLPCTQIMELIGSSTWIAEFLAVFHFPNLESLSMLVGSPQPGQPRSIVDILGPEPAFSELRHLKIGPSCLLTPECGHTLSHFTRLESLEAHVRSSLRNTNDPRTSEDLTGFLRALEISDPTHQRCPTLREMVLGVRDWDDQSLSALADCLESRRTSLRFLCLYLPRRGVLSTRRIDGLMYSRSTTLVDPDNPRSWVRHEWETPTKPELELHWQTVASSSPPVSKISLLPPELLGEIFDCLSFALWDGGSDMSALYCVLAVCRTWANGARSTPRIWAFIDLFGMSDAASALARLSKHVVLSAECPVCLRLPLYSRAWYTGEDAIWDTITVVRSVFSRMKGLVLRIESPALFHALFPSGTHQKAPLLEWIRIENKRNLLRDLTNPSRPSIITPNLRSLTYVGAPTPSLLNGIKHLERLEIYTRSMFAMHSGFNVDDLLETLSNAPAISLHLELEEKMNHSYSGKQHELRYLAHLEAVDSNNAIWLPAVLSATRLPALETLSVILRRDNAYGYAQPVFLATLFPPGSSFPLLRALTIENCTLSPACAGTLSQFVALETLELASMQHTSGDDSPLARFFRVMSPVAERGWDDHPCPRLRAVTLDVRHWDAPSFSACSDFVVSRVGSGGALERVRLLLPRVHAFSTARLDESGGSHTVQAADPEDPWSWCMHEWKFGSSQKENVRKAISIYR